MCVVVTHKNYATTYIGLCGSFCSKGVRILRCECEERGKKRAGHKYTNKHIRTLTRSLAHSQMHINTQTKTVAIIAKWKGKKKKVITISAIHPKVRVCFSFFLTVNRLHGWSCFVRFYVYCNRLVRVRACVFLPFVKHLILKLSYIWTTRTHKIRWSSTKTCSVHPLCCNTESMALNWNLG